VKCDKKSKEPSESSSSDSDDDGNDYDGDGNPIDGQLKFNFLSTLSFHL